MGIILLVLIGFLPTHYALDLNDPSRAKDVREAAAAIHAILREQEPVALTAAIRSDLEAIVANLAGKDSFAAVAPADRWETRQAIFRLRRELGRAGTSRAVREAIARYTQQFEQAIEYVPTWVVVGVALALGIGTMIGYQRIVVTVAEKIGKSHLTYAQGAAAEVVAAVTIGLADVAHLPVSTTQVLSSGVAGTMWANRSGIQGETVRKIGLAWVLTLPASLALSAILFSVGGFLIPSARPQTQTAATLAAPVPPAAAAQEWVPPEAMSRADGRPHTPRAAAAGLPGGGSRSDRTSGSPFRSTAGGHGLDSGPSRLRR
jgi:phosphate/sulfate permease